MRDRLNALASGAGADVIANDVLIGGLKFIRGGNTASSVVHRTLESPHAGTHENHNGIYIASSVLGDDTIVGLANSDNAMVAHQSSCFVSIFSMRCDARERAMYGQLVCHRDSTL